MCKCGSVEVDGRISNNCFRSLDAPVEVLGALNLPAVPMNIVLEKTMLPNADMVVEMLENIVLLIQGPFLK